jgi:hypothetical protein
MLESVRHYEIRPDVDRSRGRPHRWPFEDVIKVAEKLRDILLRNTEGRISPYLSFKLRQLVPPILRYPVDVTDALSDGQINIREAAYIARLTPESLECVPKKARQLRAELLMVHLLTKGS